MEKFKISDIQELFTTDVERFHSLTLHHVKELLAQTPPLQESLDEALRQTHTLKGLAATVQAWGLSRLGADYEALLELAGSWMRSEPDRANAIFQFITAHQQDWYLMNQFSCMDMLPQASEIYEGLRTAMEEQWLDYLPARQAGDVSATQFVRLSDLELQGAPEASAAPVPELDVQTAQPVAEAKPAAPTPLRVVPPVLRQRAADAAAEPPTPSPVDRDMQLRAPIPHAELPAPPAPLPVVPPSLRRKAAAASAAPRAETPAAAEAAAPARPQPLEVVPPTLRRVDLKPEPTPVAPAAAPAAHLAAAPEAAPTAPPILRVAPPALKRRVSKTAAPVAPPVPVVAEIPAAAPVAPVVDQAALEAALAAPVVPTPSSAEPVAAKAPTAVPGAPDSDLLEMLGREVAGYLTELTAHLPVLVASLADAEQWETARRIFHTIKGTAATFSLAAVSSPAKAAEAHCIVAIEDPEARTREAFNTCVKRAHAIAHALGLTFVEPALATAPVQPVPLAAETDLLEMLGQEVAGYLGELSTRLAALATQLGEIEPWEETRRIFHTIKGTAATFHLDAVSAPAKAAEARCIVAVEDAAARTRDAFETCLHRAEVIAKALQLAFDAEPLRAALENALVAAAPVASETAPAGPALDPEMVGFFIRDAGDQIQLIEQSVLRWEQVGGAAGQPGDAAAQPEALACVWAAQRGFHTLKGAANSIGLTAVAQSVHDVESYLETLAATGAAGTRALFTFLLGAVDRLRSYLAELAKDPAAPWRQDWATALQTLTAPASAPAAPAETAPEVAAEPEAEDERTLRVEASRLYQLVNLIGEMVVDRARLERKLETMLGLHRALDERNRALAASVQTFHQEYEFNLLSARQSAGGSQPSALSRQPSAGGSAGSEFTELEFDRYDQFNILARSLVEVSHDIGELNGELTACLEDFGADNSRFRLTSQALQSQVTGLSLVPVKTLFPRLQRAFRDALNVERKEADLDLRGGEAHLDKVVVDAVYGPLLHLLRNAVAHGIEDALTRQRAGKPARGQVSFAAVQRANQIEIQITDDGAGVDAAAVRRRAVEKGWLAADAPELTPEQVAGYIFQPGFSTAAKVTSVAGRGVGLDVVRAEIEALNGSVELRYVPGVGSTWTLRLPLTLLISEAILAEVGARTFALPLNFVESGLILDGPILRDEQGREWYELEGATSGGPAVPQVKLPVMRLAQQLQIPGDAQSLKGVIMAVGDRRVIVVVDRVLTRQEIVIKELDALTAQHPLLNGATIDAAGGVIPILNVPALLQWDISKLTPAAARPNADAGAGGSLNAAPAGPRRVLIVDDSLSVRKVQERMLRELGCAVVAAKDGLDALERMREAQFDCVFTDLEMPRLNGYELIAELRGNPAWSGTPVVVISSRGADKYITKAMNLGAATFLSKPFTQEQLGQVLQHYVRGPG